MAEDSKAFHKKCGDCARFRVQVLDVQTMKTSVNTWMAVHSWMLDVWLVATSFQEPKAKLRGQERKKVKDSGLSESGYFEAIYHEGKPCFLVVEKGNFSIAESVEIKEETFYPKEIKHIPYEHYGYFEGSVPNREDLFWKINQEFQRFIDVENIWKDVLSACVLLSYHQEKLQTVPYLFLYGDNESGKSTVLQLLRFLCYRPMYGVTVPSADLYGYLEDLDSIGTILEDEIQESTRTRTKSRSTNQAINREPWFPEP